MPSWALFLLTLATRLPLVWIGYGVHTDGWRAVNAVRTMLETGEYVTSRPPGYPLPEAILALVALAFGDSPPVINLVTAVYSGVAAVAFRLILDSAAVPHAAWLALLTFCFPVLLIESTGAKEYLCALMFLLLSWRALIDGRPVLGGALLGFAAASRPTSALFGASALTWFALHHAPHWGLALRRTIAYGAAGAAVTAVAFLPLAWKYGERLLDVAQFRPGAVRIVYAASLGTVGLIGTAVLAVLLATALARLARAAASGTLAARPLPVAHLTTAAVTAASFVLAYLAMPYEGAYLMPALIALVMILALAVPPRVVVAGCALIASSSLLLSAYQRNGDIVVDAAGSAVVDQIERRRLDCIGRSAGAFAAGLGEDEYLIAAHRMPVVRYFAPPQRRLQVIDQIDARDGDRYVVGPDANGAVTARRDRMAAVPASARFDVIDEIAVYQPEIAGLAAREVSFADRCPIPSTALLRIPLDLRRRGR